MKVLLEGAKSHRWNREEKFNHELEFVEAVPSARRSAVGRDRDVRPRHWGGRSGGLAFKELGLRIRVFDFIS